MLLHIEIPEDVSSTADGGIPDWSRPEDKRNGSGHRGWVLLEEENLEARQSTLRPPGHVRLVLLPPLSAPTPTRLHSVTTSAVSPTKVAFTPFLLSSHITFLTHILQTRTKHCTLRKNEPAVLLKYYRKGFPGLWDSHLQWARHGRGCFLCSGAGCTAVTTSLSTHLMKKDSARPVREPPRRDNYSQSHGGLPRRRPSPGERLLVVLSASEKSVHTALWEMV